MFRVGQKVVCVDASQPRITGNKHDLKKGAIYTVAAAGLIHPSDVKELPCILVEELPDHTDGLWQHRFRPIVEHKTDISIFKRLLVPSSKIRETV